MKKIVPFNNVLNFDTDVCEITAISLEHEIKNDEGTVSGVFFISGEYKITDGQIDKDKFSFELPFDIALGCDYNLDTMVVDIDDFRYELIDRNKLKVNIDLYIDGEVIEHPTIIDSEEVSVEKVDDTEFIDNLEMNDDRSGEEEVKPEIEDTIDVLEELTNDREEEMDKQEITIENINVNDNDNPNENINSSSEEEIDLFNGFNEEEKYVTYRVYRVSEGDTLDKILKKYNTTKEELAKYNNISEINVGDKLIIPAND